MIPVMEPALAMAAGLEREEAQAPFALAATGRPACDGDARWVERALRDHGTEVWRYLVHRVGTRDVADDLLGEVFLALVRDARRVRSRNIPVRAWLFRVASRRATDHHRIAKRRPSSVGIDAAQRAAPIDTGSPDDRARLWREALASLSPAHQNVLVLFHIHGLSIEQIGQVEGCGIGTTKSRLARAREALRRAVIQRGGEA